MEWQTYHTRNIKAKYLYRYMSIDKLSYFLRTGELFFPRIDKFQDGMEGIVPYDISELVANLPELPTIEERNKDIPEDLWESIEADRLKTLTAIRSKLQKKQKHLYASCWYLGDSESNGMWELYGLNGILLRFERIYLQKLIRDSRNIQTINFHDQDLLVAGLIRYQNFEEIPWNEEDSLIKYSGFRKHVAFKHEEEFRFILHKRDILENGLSYKIGKPSTLNFELFANPQIKPSKLKKYQNSISAYGDFDIKESHLKKWLEFKKSPIQSSILSRIVHRLKKFLTQFSLI